MGREIVGNESLKRGREQFRYGGKPVSGSVPSAAVKTETLTLLKFFRPLPFSCVLLFFFSCVDPTFEVAKGSFFAAFVGANDGCFEVGNAQIA